MVSELALEIILNIPDDSNISANTKITIQGDKYTVSYGGDFQYENDLENGSNDSITLSQFLENTSDELLPFLITVPLQKLAYYSALKKGYDIDKPRNLAKSVTVE